MGRVALVTGATGYIGNRLVKALANNDWTVNASSRHDPANIDIDIGDRVNWFRVVAPTAGAAAALPGPALSGVETVFHLAGIAHQSDITSESVYKSVNVDNSLALARQASQAGVRHFVFVSSIAAIAKQSGVEPLTAQSKPTPGGPYGRSKLQAENALTDFCRTTGLTLSIVRPPLVYGPHPKANLKTLIRLVKLGLPLPLAGVQNTRSMIGLTNLVELLELIATESRLQGQMLMPADVHWSTPDLIRCIANAVQTRARLFAAPAIVLRTLCQFPVIGSPITSLCTSLAQSDRFLTESIGWQPTMSVEQEIGAMVDSMKSGSAL